MKVYAKSFEHLLKLDTKYSLSYIKDINPKLLTVKHKNKQYTLVTIYSLVPLNKKQLIAKTILLSIITFSLALIFKKFRDDWSTILSGKRVRSIFVDENVAKKLKELFYQSVESVESAPAQNPSKLPVTESDNSPQNSLIKELNSTTDSEESTPAQTSITQSDNFPQASVIKEEEKESNYLKTNSRKRPPPRLLKHRALESKSLPENSKIQASEIDNRLNQLTEVIVERLLQSQKCLYNLELDSLKYKIDNIIYLRKYLLNLGAEDLAQRDYDECCTDILKIFEFKNIDEKDIQTVIVRLLRTGTLSYENLGAVLVNYHKVKSIEELRLVPRKGHSISNEECVKEFPEIQEEFEKNPYSHICMLAKKFLQSQKKLFELELDSLKYRLKYAIYYRRYLSRLGVQDLPPYDYDKFFEEIIEIFKFENLDKNALKKIMNPLLHECPISYDMIVQALAQSQGLQKIEELKLAPREKPSLSKDEIERFKKEIQKDLT